MRHDNVWHPIRVTRRAPEPGEAGGDLFSTENKRFSILAIVIASVMVATIVCITVLITKGHEQGTITLTAFAGLGLAQAWHMIRAEQNRNEQRRELIEAKQDRKEIKETVRSMEEKTNGNLEHAVEKAAEKVKEAITTPAPGQEAMPRTIEELEGLLERFANRMCGGIADRAAQAAAERAAELVRAELRQGKPSC